MFVPDKLNQIKHGLPAITPVLLVKSKGSGMALHVSVTPVTLIIQPSTSILGSICNRVPAR